MRQFLLIDLLPILPFDYALRGVQIGPASASLNLGDICRSLRLAKVAAWTRRHHTAILAADAMAERAASDIANPSVSVFPHPTRLHAAPRTGRHQPVRAPDAHPYLTPRMLHPRVHVPMKHAQVLTLLSLLLSLLFLWHYIACVYFYLSDVRVGGWHATRGMRTWHVQWRPACLPPPSSPLVFTPLVFTPTGR